LIRAKAPDWYSFEKKRGDTLLNKLNESEGKKYEGSLTDDQIIEKASNAANAHTFLKMFRDGDHSGYNNNSRNEADLAFANLIAFYTDNKNQIERIMRRSRLSRNEKWDRQAYLDLTIGKAIENKSRPMWKPGYKTVPPTTDNEEPREQITAEQIEAYREEHIRSFSELPELPEGFFRDYMAYGTRMSYAYPAFHFGVSLAITSLLFGRRVVMQSTAGMIYPNAYVAIIGLTSISGKSTACDLGYDHFFPIVRKEQAVEDLTAKNTPQGFIERLVAVPTRLWYYDECSEFFNDVTNKWAEALVSNLCKAYDGRSLSYGLSKGRGKVDEYRTPNVFLTCLWNTTCDEMENKAQYSLVSNGFLPRFMWFWCHAKNEPRENRETTAEDRAIRETLQKKLQRVKNIMDDPKIAHMQENRIIFKPHPKIEKWKLDNDRKHIQKEFEMHRIATARLMPQCYKIAMLLSMMDDDVLLVIENNVTFPLSLKIPDKYANLAIDICEHYLRPRLEYLMDLSKNNDTKNLQIQVIRCLKKYNGIAKKSLVQHETHINKRNFDETIVSLEESETIQILDGEISGGRRGIILKLLKG
jgi:hypothetical protein